MSDRLFDVVKTNDDLQKIVRAVARGIDPTDVQEALEDLGLDVEVDTIDWNTWSQIEISGGENETGVIITLVVKEIEVGFDRLTVGQEDADPTPPADDVRAALATVWLTSYRGSIDATALTLAFKAGYAAAEVRPHGTVTDAEAKAARNALRDAGYVIPMHVVRDTVKAAREVSSDV